MSSKVIPAAFIYKISSGDSSVVCYGTTRNMQERIKQFQSDLANKDYKLEVMESLVNVSKNELERRVNANMQSKIFVNNCTSIYNN